MILISEYPSIRDAERKTELSRGNISKCCKHKVTYVGGYVWRFEGDITPPKYKKIVSVCKYDLNHNFIKEYDTISDAVRDNGLTPGTISRCCKGVTKSAGGFIWKYKNDILI